jgi:predicted ferric reductase
MASLAGLSGLLLFGVTVVLSARFRWVESLVGGLDKVYRSHQRLGSLAFVVILVHPALLSWERAHLSVRRAARVWLPGGDAGMLAGQAALALMIPALVLTLFAAVRHQTLVALQRLLGLLFMPAAFHAITADGTAAETPILRALTIVIVTLGLASLVKHTLLGRTLDRHRPYEVVSVRHLGTDLAELRLRPTEGAMQFVPGQFAYLRLRDAAVSAEPHPFSIASSAAEDELRFVVKELGDWTGGLESVASGTAAVAEGPYGRFSHRFVKGRRQLWVAGGIGITPFLSMAASLAVDGCPYDVDLVWCYPRHDTAPELLDELSSLAAQRPHLRLHARCDLEHPLLSAAALADICATSPAGPLADREVLLCGPTVMRDALRSQLLDAGVRAPRIHEEGFAYR